MNRKEDDLRRQLDFDKKANQEEYEELFDILTKIDDEPLHDHVYRTVIDRIEQKEKKRKLMILGSYVLGILMVLLLSLSALFYFLGDELLEGLLDYSTWVLMGVAALLLVQYLDYSLVRKKLDRTFLDLKKDPTSI